MTVSVGGYRHSPMSQVSNKIRLPFLESKELRHVYYSAKVGFWYENEKNFGLIFSIRTSRK